MDIRLYHHLSKIINKSWLLNERAGFFASPLVYNVMQRRSMEPASSLSGPDTAGFIELSEGEMNVCNA
jgi:hypothetical protein